MDNAFQERSHATDEGHEEERTIDAIEIIKKVFGKSTIEGVEEEEASNREEENEEEEQND